MKKQLLHEHHNRQDRARNADYRAEMIERGRSRHSATGINVQQLVNRAAAKKDAALAKTLRGKEPELESELLDDMAEGRISVGGLTGRINRAEAREHFKKCAINEWRKARFVHGGHVLKLGWPLNQFAKINNLLSTDVAAQRAFESLTKMAERDMQKIANAIMRGTVHYRQLHECCTIPFVDWDSSTIEVECDEIE